MEKYEIDYRVKEQINILRRLSAGCHNEWKADLGYALSNAADTIESLSAKLGAANKEIEDLNAIKEVSQEYSMERAYGKWIYCGDGKNLPEKPFDCIVTVIDTDPMTMANFETILPYQVGYSGETWNNSDGEQIPFEVIAWMAAPKEPYHESLTNPSPTANAAERKNSLEQDEKCSILMALEKQIPKKARHDGCYDSNGAWHEWNGVNGRPYELCPNCGINLCCEMPNDKKPKFCEECGQAIDWSE